MPFALAPNPKWIAFFNGQLAAGGQVYTYIANTRTEKATYADINGTIANTNPVQLDGEGAATIYWDTAENYYIEVYSANGLLIYTEDNYSPNATGGGAPTNYYSHHNLIRNGDFRLWAFLATSDVSTNITASQTATNWFFIKSKTGATDSVSRQTFALAQADVPNFPKYYMRVECTTATTGETFKRIYIEFEDVNFLEQTEYVLNFYAKASAAISIEAKWIQNFGTGGSPSSSVTTNIASFNVTTAWQNFSHTGSGSTLPPSLSGKSIGDNEDDNVQLIIDLPLNATFQFDFSHANLRVTNFSNDFQYFSTDGYKNELIREESGLQTGTVMSGFYTSEMAGFLKMNDQTVGSPSSTATYKSELVRDLYILLWDNISDTYCPVSTGRGANARADWIANKTLTIPRSLGRMLIGSGSAGSGLTARPLGEYSGSESIVLTKGHIPAHVHTYTRYLDLAIKDGDDSPPAWVGTSTENTGDGTADGLKDPPDAVDKMNPFISINYFIKL